MADQLQEKVTSAALETTRAALADDRLSDAAKLLYLDVVARYAGSYGWMVGNTAWSADHLRELVAYGYIHPSDHGKDFVAVDAIREVIEQHKPD